MRSALLAAERASAGRALEPEADVAFGQRVPEQAGVLAPIGRSRRCTSAERGLEQLGAQPRPLLTGSGSEARIAAAVSSSSVAMLRRRRHRRRRCRFRGGIGELTRRWIRAVWAST